MYKITDAPLLNFASPPFYPDKECKGSKTKIFAPGSKKDTVKLYNIYLLIKLKETIHSNNSVIATKNYTVEALGLLENDRCNSFVTHKYTSSPKDL
ncbi:hypothetical protein DSO57_1019025 [Entomophthora muscae]|uniref:Uncharacterized protein n=1 Tax=Entomophthora muscae TaxID=34485 RepID=A0ACC2TRP0_9FUNG|nr:hypothetical protein DSO57_1019025 [Entomophthora muscae]